MFEYNEKKEFRSLLLEVQEYSLPKGIDNVVEDFFPVVRLIVDNLGAYFAAIKRENLSAVPNYKVAYQTLLVLLNFSSMTEEGRAQLQAAMKMYPALSVLHKIRQKDRSVYESKEQEINFVILHDKSKKYVSDYVSFSSTIFFGHLAGVVSLLERENEKIDLERKLINNPIYGSFFRKQFNERKMKEEKAAARKVRVDMDDLKEDIVEQKGIEIVVVTESEPKSDVKTSMKRKRVVAAGERKVKDVEWRELLIENMNLKKQEEKKAEKKAEKHEDKNYKESVVASRYFYDRFGIRHRKRKLLKTSSQPVEDGVDDASLKKAAKC